MNLIFTATLFLSISSCNLLIIEKRIASPKDFSTNDPNVLVKSQLTSLIINGIDSPPRLFYARLLYRREYCGATILSDRFLATAGHCVHSVQHLKNAMMVEVGDFSQKSSLRVQYTIERIFVNPLYNGNGQVPFTDIALVKTEAVIENGNEMAIRLCDLEESMITHDINTKIIGFCGMGSATIDSRHTVLPRQLKQMIFKQTVLNEHVHAVSYPQACPDDMICTQAVIENGNICLMDDGGPLYKFFCRSMVPDCLLGIASFSIARDDTPLLVCNNGSFFTNIPLFKDWIDYVMDHNKN